MFLTQDNKMKWKLLAYATVVVAVIIALGVMWFDAPVYLAMRGFNCKLWGVFDTIFDAKMWVGASFVIMCAFYGKKTLESKPCFKNDKNRFSVMCFLYFALFYRHPLLPRY